jgi:hypothetical protein
MTRSFHRRRDQHRYSQRAHAEAFAHWMGQDRRTTFEGDSEADAIEAAFVDCMLSGFAGHADDFKRLLAREGHKPTRHVRRWRLFIPNRTMAGAAE